jgi:hypothetical protein
MAVTIGEEDLEPGIRCDYCSQPGAAVLAQMVRDFWSAFWL